MYTELDGQIYKVYQRDNMKWIIKKYEKDTESNDRKEYREIVDEASLSDIFSVYFYVEEDNFKIAIVNFDKNILEIGTTFPVFSKKPGYKAVEHDYWEKKVSICEYDHFIFKKSSYLTDKTKEYRVSPREFRALWKTYKTNFKI